MPIEATAARYMSHYKRSNHARRLLLEGCLSSLLHDLPFQEEQSLIARPNRCLTCVDHQHSNRALSYRIHFAELVIAQVSITSPVPLLPLFHTCSYVITVRFVHSNRP